MDVVHEKQLHLHLNETADCAIASRDLQNTVKKSDLVVHENVGSLSYEQSRLMSEGFLAERTLDATMRVPRRPRPTYQYPSVI